jgi:hypothetical protein
MGKRKGRGEREQHLPPVMHTGIAKVCVQMIREAG